MVSPKSLSTNVALGSATAPVVCLLDALSAQGFVGHPRRCAHSASGAKEFDDRGVVAKRTYLQCVLSQVELFRQGIGTFGSGQPSAYYSLLLQGHDVQPGLGAAEYKRRLGELSGEFVAVAALATRAPPATTRAAASSSTAAPQPQDEDSSIAFDSDAEHVGGSAAVPELAPSPGPNAEAAAAEDDIVLDGVVHRAPSHSDLPLSIDGQALRRVPGRSGGGWNYHSRVAIHCSNPLHKNCTNRRSVAMDVSSHGPLACVYFLGAWLGVAGDMPADAHRAFRPSAAQMEAFAASYRPS